MSVLKKILSLKILLSSLVFIFFSPKKISLKLNYNNISPPMDIAPYLLEHLSCLSHYKTRWTMSVNNASLKICLSETSNPMVTLTILSLM